MATKGKAPAMNINKPRKGSGGGGSKSDLAMDKKSPGLKGASGAKGNNFKPRKSRMTGNN